MRKQIVVSRKAVAVMSATIMAVGQAAIVNHPQAEAQSLDLARKAIVLRSVRGPGNKTLEVAALYKAALVAGGWAEEEIST